MSIVIYEQKYGFFNFAENYAGYWPTFFLRQKGSATQRKILEVIKHKKLKIQYLEKYRNYSLMGLKTWFHEFKIEKVGWWGDKKVKQIGWKFWRSFSIKSLQFNIW